MLSNCPTQTYNVEILIKIRPEENNLETVEVYGRAKVCFLKQTSYTVEIITFLFAENLGHNFCLGFDWPWQYVNRGAKDESTNYLVFYTKSPKASLSLFNTVWEFSSETDSLDTWSHPFYIFLGMLSKPWTKWGQSDYPKKSHTSVVLRRWENLSDTGRFTKSVSEYTYLVKYPAYWLYSIIVWESFFKFQSLFVSNNSVIYHNPTCESCFKFFSSMFWLHQEIYP